MLLYFIFSPAVNISFWSFQYKHCNLQSYVCKYSVIFIPFADRIQYDLLCVNVFVQMCKFPS